MLNVFNNVKSMWKKKVSSTKYRKENKRKCFPTFPVLPLQNSFLKLNIFLVWKLVTLKILDRFEKNKKGLKERNFFCKVT